MPETNDVNMLFQEMNKLNQNLSLFKPVYKIGEEQNWKYEEANKTITFFRKVTLNTTPNNFDLYIPYPFLFLRTDMAFSSTNPKTVSWRMYAGISPSVYTELRTETANTDTSLIVQGGIEYPYKAGTKISLVFSDFTNNDTVEISLSIQKVL